MERYLQCLLVFFFVVILSGCSVGIGGSSSGEIGGVLVSKNSGVDWELKNRVDDKQNISKVDVLTVAIDPVDNERVYLGTKDKGVVVSKDGAESWEKIKFPANKVYGIAVNYFKPSDIYALGVSGERGKAYRTDNYGETWSEIYTEPADGTVIISLAMDKNNPMVLYMGTSKGVILKTVDGGETWRSLYTASGPVTKIVFGGGLDRHIYFVVQESQILVSDINGDNFKVISGAVNNVENKGLGKIYSLAVSDSDNGALYIGTDNGIFRSYNAGENLEEVGVLATSKGFPIRSMAVNPKNSQEIVYSAAQAIYKSTDAGKNWSTYQLNTGKLISEIIFKPSDVNIIYAGLRSFK
ncbi:MAG: WD40/YVTN/BNR-like repeat-containing protein [Candidatus Moraniibacteriota bacterium]